MTRLLTTVWNRGRKAAVMNGNRMSHAHAAGRRAQMVRRSSYVITSAESAPCTCPDFCERDHEND